MKNNNPVVKSGHYVERDTFVLPTYPLSHRVIRGFWGVVSLFLFRASPVPAFAWRNFLLRLFGASVGRGVKIYPTVKVWAPWNLELGDMSCIGPNVDVYCMDKLTLGERALVSQRSFLCCGSHDINSTHFDLITKPIHIGRSAWVAAEAFVGPGVVVGDGAVVGARACVVRNVDPFDVVAGVPAKKVGIRQSHALVVVEST